MQRVIATARSLLWPDRHGHLGQRAAGHVRFSPRLYVWIDFGFLKPEPVE